MTPSLRRQLLWRVVPPVVIVVMISAVATYTLGLRFATDAYDTALFDSARSLAQQIRPGMNGAPLLDLPEAAQQILVSDPYDRIFYAVIAANGTQVAGNAMIPLPPRAPVAERPLVFYDARVAGETVRVGSYTLFATRTAPTATVLFAETLVKRNRLAQQLLWTLTLPLIVVVGLVVALIWDAVRRGLTPLNRLASVLSERGWADLRKVGHGQVPVEVRPLVDSLDGLMVRLGAAHQAQQRFISDAAHQLRTPLAGLSAQINRALRARDVQTNKSALQQVQTSLRRMTRLVNQLLSLARAEPGSDPQQQLVPMDLSRLVQQTCRDLVPAALAQEMDLGFAGDCDPLMIVGHELLLAAMLNNLIDNALRYASHPGGCITVRLKRQPFPQITVEDDGPGIPLIEHENIFERFRRLPGSAAGGCGLGLAIVREIAKLHGAEVVVEPRPAGTGAVFRVTFPACEPQQDIATCTATGVAAEAA